MKNFLFISNLVLIVAVVVLFVLLFGNKNKECAPKENSSLEGAVISSSSSSFLPIAYVNIDSLFFNYNLAKDANEVLMKKGEESRLTLNTKANQFQKELADFQRKLENNAFLSRERAEREQERLGKKQQELQELDTKLSTELYEHQQKINNQLRDTISLFLKEYNKDGKYEVIFSNTGNDNILIANKAYDITPEIVKALNSRYTKK